MKIWFHVVHQLAINGKVWEYFNREKSKTDVKALLTTFGRINNDASTNAWINANSNSDG